MSRLTINGFPTTATVTATYNETTVSGIGSVVIEAESGTVVSYEVVADQCTPKSGTETIAADKTLEVILNYIGSVSVDTWIPATGKATFPTHIAMLGKGGWREVSSLEERDAIVPARREAGMAVYVTENATLYILNQDLVSWSEFKAGSSDSIRKADDMSTFVPLFDGEIVQYVGSDESSDEYVTGYFYQATIHDESDESGAYVYYTYEQINVQPSTEIVWGNIGGTLADQEDLQSELSSLQSQINDLSGRGRYLSTWDCSTGLAETNPPTSPYEYKSGDYFIISKVAEDEESGESGESGEVAINYRPDGSSYVSDVPSTTIELAEVHVNDTYIYDGEHWILLSNTSKEVSFSALTGDPYDNTELASALNAKVEDVQLYNITSGEYESVVTDNIALLAPEAQDVAYTNEQYPTMKTLQDAMDKLLYITPSVSMSGGGSYERGTAISSVNLAWNWNKKITSQSLNAGIGALDPSVRSYTYTPAEPITSNTTFTISGSDGTTSKSASTSVSFFIKKYYGASALEELSDEDIRALTNATSSRALASTNFDFGSGKYWYYCIPKETDNGAALVFSIGPAGSEALQSGNYFIYEKNDFKNAQGVTIPLRIYKFKKTPSGQPDTLTGSLNVKVA